jgi:hypothetical protein
MSHFAEINADNKVIRVIVADNSMPNEGLNWIIDNVGGTWIQTSYNNNIRFNYAGVGYTYDENRNAFIAPKCHDEAILNEATCRWDCENADHFERNALP